MDIIYIFQFIFMDIYGYFWIYVGYFWIYINSQEFAVGYPTYNHIYPWFIIL